MYTTLFDFFLNGPAALLLGLSIKNIPMNANKEVLRKAIIDFCSTDPEVVKFLASTFQLLIKNPLKGERSRTNLVKRVAEKTLKKFTICAEKTDTVRPGKSKNLPKCI